MTELNGNPAVKRAWDALGGCVQLASRLGVSQPAVSMWHTGLRRVPLHVCIEIEKLTGSQVRCEDLRPDVDWEFLRKSKYCEVMDHE